MFPKKLSEAPQLKEQPPSIDSSENEDDNVQALLKSKKKEHSSTVHLSHRPKSGSKGMLHSPAGSMHSFDLQVDFLFVSCSLFK